MKFTANQRLAIETDCTKTLVVAGPGSGKTEVLVQRILELLRRHIPAKSIVVITFTNEAAREIRRRLFERLGHEVKLGYVGTLHSYCLRLLQTHGAAMGYPSRITVLNEEQSDELLRQAAAMMSYKGTFKKLVELRENWNGYSGPAKTEDIVVGTYHRMLKQSGSVDYRLILSETLLLLQAKMPAGPGIAYLLVDEFQDSGGLDWDLYRAFKAGNYFLVGDPDQAIYQWRGGEVGIIVRLAGDREWETIWLQENFRSAPPICLAAQRLISRNADRVPKLTVSMRDGAPGIINVREPFPTGEQEELQIMQDVAAKVRGEIPVKPSDVAVLTRTNAIVDRLIKLAEAFGLPVNKRQPMPEDWRFATLTVDMLVNPRNDLVFSFWINEMLKLRGIPENVRISEIQKYRDMAAGAGKPLCAAALNGDVPNVDVKTFAGWMWAHSISADSMGLIDRTVAELDDPTLAEIALALTRDNTPKLSGGDGVTITTMHAAKGREWPHIYIVGADQNIVPGTRKNMDVEAERRLFFVAVTRAKDALTISSAKARKPGHSFKDEPSEPSQFIRELL